MEIKIAVKGAKTLDFKELKEAQGQLKTLPKESYERLRNHIAKDGFSEPITVWFFKGKYNVINGHQRLSTIRKMVEEEGYKCPKIPVSLMEAKNWKEAKRKILSMTSQFGKFDKQGLFDFLKGSDILLEELSGDFDFAGFDTLGFMEEFFPQGKDENDMLGEAEEIQAEGEQVGAHTKMVQLFMDLTTAAEFEKQIERLKEEYKTTNLTDTVLSAVKECYVKRTTRTRKAEG